MKRKNSNALLLDKKTQHIYLNFKNFLISHLKGKKFLVAVSGGPDSLALAYLSKIFCNELNYSFSAIIIDHGVRKKSDQEAKKVKQLLLKHKIKSSVFKINCKSGKNFHLEARKKRYEKISSFCKKNKIKSVLLGHHLDDVVENFYIRLSRGSGLSGLTPIKKVSKLNGQTYLRPFL